MGLNQNTVSFELVFDIGGGKILLCQFDKKTNAPEKCMVIENIFVNFDFNNIDEGIEKIKLQKLLSNKYIHQLKNRILQSILSLL